MPSSEDHPEKVRVWSIKEAGDIIALEVQNDPGILITLLDLTGGDSSLFVPILDHIANSYSFEPTRITPLSFREFSGAPKDSTMLDSWRMGLIEAYETKRLETQHSGVN